MATPMIPRPKNPTFGLPSEAFVAESLHGWKSLVILRGLAERNGTTLWPRFIKTFLPENPGRDPKMYTDEIDNF